MSIHITRTPSGWRRLRRNEKRRVGDRVWSLGEGPWVDLVAGLPSIGAEYWPQHPNNHFPVIRRKPKSRK